MKLKPERIFARDGWTCFLCGLELRDGSLIPHHRANRGNGGFKAADKPSNVLSLCSFCNGVIESDATQATQARNWGVKVSKFDTGRTHEIPVFSRSDGWLLLDDSYGVSFTEPPNTY